MIKKLLVKKMLDHPVFIVGDGRSGTSALLQALGKHPNILAAPGEAPLITSVGGMISNFEFGDKRTIEYYKESLKFSRTYMDNYLKRFCFEIAMGEDYGFKYLIRELLKKPGSFFEKSYWTAKTFPPEIVAKSLLKLYPTAKFIYIIRNGIDVAHSKTKFHGFRSESFEIICRTWEENYRKYKYIAELESGLKIYYEDLLEKSEDVLQRIVDLIDIGNDNGPVDFLSSNLIHPLDKPTENDVDARELIKVRAPAHESWSEEQKKIFKEICGETMRANNYEIPF